MRILLKILIFLSILIVLWFASHVKYLSDVTITWHRKQEHFYSSDKLSFPYYPSSNIRTYETNVKRIIVMNNPIWPWFRTATDLLNSCPVKCTLEKNGKNISAFDVVIFYAAGYMQDLPPRKPPGQIWVFMTIESPLYTAGRQFKNKEWREKFNWTMTYRLDTDVPYPYGSINRRKSPVSLDFSDVVKHKTKLAAWFVSNCKTPSRREEYVRELKNFISVDIYGKCGDKKCDKTKDNCNLLLTRDYKFYLAFENSLCYDYVTEKTYNYMRSDIVPVVRGGANYTKFLPPNSYINTADFKSPKYLAEYLLYLDKNDTAFIEILQWKNYYTVGERHVGACELCKKLYDPTLKPKVYPDIHSWYFGHTCYIRKDW